MVFVQARLYILAALLPEAVAFQDDVPEEEQQGAGEVIGIGEVGVEVGRVEAGEVLDGAGRVHDVRRVAGQQVAATGAAIYQQPVAIGMIFFDLEKYERALMEFEKVENDYKYSGEYFFFRAEAKYYLKDRKGSCTDYKMASDLGDQDSMNVYQNYCLDNKDKGRFKRNRETKVNL